MKKILSYLLVLLTLINTVAPALAATTYTDSILDVEYCDHSEDYTGTTVYAEIGSEFKVTIPKKVTLDGALKSGTYNVLVEGDIAGNEYVKVVPETYFLLYTKDKAPIPATVSQDRTGWSFLDFGTKANGLIETEGMTAGAWNGTFNFNIKLESSMELDSTINGGIINPDDGGEQVTLKVNNVSGVQKEQLLDALEESGQVESTDDIDAMINITTSNNTLEGINDITINTSGVANPGDTVVIVQEKENEWDYISTETVNTNNEVKVPMMSTRPMAFVQTQSDGTVHVHKYEEDIVEEATCSTNGTLSMMCECFKEYAFSIPASHELEQVEKKDENGELINKYYQCENCAYSILNLTQLFAGNELSHDCNKYLITKYDANNHWKECSVCEYKINNTQHTFTRTWMLGTESCLWTNSATDVCNDCGYSKTYKKPCVWDGRSYVCNNSSLGNHSKKCSVCNSVVSSEFYYNGTLMTNDNTRCNDAQGILGCTNTGTCVNCGNTNFNNPNKHSLIMSDNKIQCSNCKIVFATYNINSTYTILTATTVRNKHVFTVIPQNGASVQSISSSLSLYYANQFTNVQKTQTTSGNSIIATFTFDTCGKYPSTTSTNSTMGMSINGVINYCYPSMSVVGDVTAPVISNVTQTDVSILNGWTLSKQIIVKGTENLSDVVTINLYDNNTLIYSGNVSVVSGSYNFTFTPDIEGDEKGKEYKIEVIDKSNNKSTKTFTILKTDNKSPQPNLNINIETNWSQTKEVLFTAIDEGSGNVQIAFNNINEYVSMDKNGTTYTKGYQFSGDVYGEIMAAIYYTDAAGNVATQFIKVYNLDNTAPTISNVAVNGKQITVTANDLNKTLNMEGSGVSKYALTWTSAPPQDSDWQDSNILNVSGNGTYYIWVKDAVGNISECYKVRIIL